MRKILKIIIRFFWETIMFFDNILEEVVIEIENKKEKK